MEDGRENIILEMPPEGRPAAVRVSRARALAFMGFFRPLWGLCRVTVPSREAAEAAEAVFIRRSSRISASAAAALLHLLLHPANLRRAWDALPAPWQSGLRRVMENSYVSAAELDPGLPLEKYALYDAAGRLTETYATPADLRNILQRVAHDGEERYTLEAPLLRALRDVVGVASTGHCHRSRGAAPTITLQPGERVGRLAEQSLRGYALFAVESADTALADAILTTPAIRRIVTLVEGDRFLIRQDDLPELNRYLRARGIVPLNLKSKQS